MVASSHPLAAQAGLRGLRALGVAVPALLPTGAEIVVRGRGLHGLAAPGGALDLGNSGTGTRLLMGMLAGQPFRAVMTGDASLSSRPMGRVTRPLSQMGARFRYLSTEDRLPLEIEGGRLSPLSYELPVASAQYIVPLHRSPSSREPQSPSLLHLQTLLPTHWPWSHLVSGVHGSPSSQLS